MIAQYIGVHRRCRLQPPHIVCRPRQKATNICGKSLNLIKWTLNLPCGKWFTYSSHHRNYTEILAIENVSKQSALDNYDDKFIIFYASHGSHRVNIFFFKFAETKSQFARDDPAFLVLLILCLFGKFPRAWKFIVSSSLLNLNCFDFSCFAVTSIGFTWTLNLTFGQTLYCIAYILIVDFILAGIIVTTFTWLFAIRYLRQNPNEADVEWGYSFDVHMNAFFPPLVLLHFVQLIFFNSKLTNEVYSRPIYWH